MKPFYVIPKASTLHVIVGLDPEAVWPGGETHLTACGRTLAGSVTSSPADHWALCQQCAKHYPVISLDLETDEHGCLVPIEIALTRAIAMQQATHALGHHPNLLSGPHLYRRDDDRRYVRVTPHLAFQWPETFSAYHAA